MSPKYTVRKSAWAAVSPLCIIFFWLIIPLIVMIVRIVSNAFTTIEFYDDKVVMKSGVLNRKESDNVFAGVLAVSVAQSLFGRIFNYGNVYIDVQGKWDISTNQIKNPHGLKKYLESRIVNINNVNFIAHS